jgi:glyoxylase-like metal-dependent hydrolase (beta-lactamase superfamily II)
MCKGVAATVLLVTLLPIGMAAEDAKSVIDQTSRAMGVEGLNSISYSGAAAQGNFGQSRVISARLASTAIRNYTRAIDFALPASRTTGETLPPAVAGGPPPPPGILNQSIAPDDASWAQQLQIWTTPWGFLRGAAANNATLRSRKVDGVTYKVLTWSPSQKAPSGQAYRVVGYVGPDNTVDRVETWVEHPILGDMHDEFIYSNYQDFGGLKAPAKISLRQVGMETFVLAIRDARANPPDIAQLLTPSSGPSGGDPPASGRGGSAAASPSAPSAAASEKLADGVFRITGGYVALAVEFRDYVIVLEGGQSEARGLAIIAETKRVIPNKRIKYVVNTHPHFDHAAGLPPFVAEGVTIITDDTNKFFLEQALGSPRTLVGDVLAKSHKKPKVEGVLEKMVLKDDTRSLELYHIEKLEHSAGMLIAYLPQEKILFTADFNVPRPGQPVSPSIATLLQNLDRLGLDFERHVLVHAPDPDRPMTKADLMELAKRLN